MTKRFTIAIFLFPVFLFPVFAMAQAPAIIWNKLLGGNNQENVDVKSIQQTADGGYIVAGSTTSSQNGDVTGVNHGGLDFWIIKLDASGNKTWDKVLGGSGDEEPASIRQTTDGGYIISGYSTSSQNGDVTGINHGSYDVWIVKLDATGNITWNKLMGSVNSEGAQKGAIIQTADGGYIAVTNSISLSTTGNPTPGGDITGDYRGGYDAWIVKLDADGNKTWDRLFGGDLTDILTSVEQLADGTYIFAGQSNSHGQTGDITSGFNMLGMNPKPDAFMVRLDANGNKLWDKRYGSYGFDVAADIHGTADGGFIVACSVYAADVFGSGDVTGPLHGSGLGDGDAWVIKLDSDGNLIWNKLLGGSGYESSSSVQQTSDGGYTMLGNSNSSQNADVTAISHGVQDIWLVKLNATGTKLWDNLLGGSAAEITGNLIKTSDGGYALSGTSYSSQSGDVTGTNHGAPDIWIVKLSPEATAGALPVSLLSFTASQQGESVVLNWSTASEQNSKDFIVQRSADGISWNNLGAVTAAGQSNALKQYSYIDPAPLRPGSSYRLLQRDLDGKSAFSAVKTVTLGGTVNGLRILGNPVTNGVLQLELGTPATISIFNMQGLQLLQQKLGAGKQNIPLSKFAKGSYTLKSGTETKLFVIQ